MTTAAGPDTKQDHTEREESPPLAPALADRTREDRADWFDPTQGRTLGSEPYDDPTQGRKLGSDPYDDPTQGRKLGSDPYDDSTQGHKLGADRFELTGRSQSGAGSIETALARNRAFAAAGGHKNAVVFPNLRLFVITCLDPRVDPAHFLGLELSDAIVVRNVGGRVTPEVINDIAFVAQIADNVLPDGLLFEVAVIHHTQCATAALTDGAFRRRYANRIDADEETLLKHAVLDRSATVADDVGQLRSAPALSSRITVSGHVYDVTTGLVRMIPPAAH
jgi:carbonic anhydrase